MKKELLFNEQEIKDAVKKLASRISNDYNGISILCVLKGSFIFCADLVRELTIPCTVDFIRAKSYENTKSLGEVIIDSCTMNVKGRDILIVDDIVDTGLTLSELSDFILYNKAKSVSICTLINKVGRRSMDVEIRYSGFNIGNKFVVGYGMDYNELYRFSRDIGTLNEKETCIK